MSPGFHIPTGHIPTASASLPGLAAHSAECQQLPALVALQSISDKMSPWEKLSQHARRQILAHSTSVALQTSLPSSETQLYSLQQDQDLVGKIGDLYWLSVSAFRRVTASIAAIYVFRVFFASY